MSGVRFSFGAVVLLLLALLWQSLERKPFADSSPGAETEGVETGGRSGPGPVPSAGIPGIDGPSGPVRETDGPGQPEQGERACLSESVGLVCTAPGETFAAPLDRAVSRLRGGELYGAIELSALIRHCRRFPRTEQEFAARFVQGWGYDPDAFSAFADSDLVRQGNPFPHSYEVGPEALARYTAGQLRCAPVFALLDGGFRSQVTRLAEAGNEAAQLLFGLWSPPDETTFEAFVEWQLTADGYAREGLSKARPLGVVAFSFGHLGAFAPLQFVVAWSYARAAMACGVDHRLLPEAFRTLDPDSPTASYSQGLFAQEAREEWTSRLLRMCMSRRDGGL